MESGCKTLVKLTRNEAAKLATELSHQLTNGEQWTEVIIKHDLFDPPGYKVQFRNIHEVKLSDG